MPGGEIRGEEQAAERDAATTSAQRGAGSARLAAAPASRSRKGTASAIRQKPAATGPTSASRTIHGPSASTRLPRISAGKAKRPCGAAGGGIIAALQALQPLGPRRPAHVKEAFMPSLFDPIQLGATLCPNRILMAPLTRGRATREHVPTELMIDYYRQRAARRPDHHRGDRDEPPGPRLALCARASGPRSRWRPGSRWSRRCTKRAGGSSASSGIWAGWCIPASSAAKRRSPPRRRRRPTRRTPMTGASLMTEARPLGSTRYRGLLDDYGRAAAYAIAAGFDGVQLHAANGYLIDQFLRDGTNYRDDDYGGPVENRIRLLVEATRAIADMVGAERTAVRLSPNSETQGARTATPRACSPPPRRRWPRSASPSSSFASPGPRGRSASPTCRRSRPSIRKVFPQPLVLNSDFTLESAEAVLDGGARRRDQLRPAVHRQSRSARAAC